MVFSCKWTSLIGLVPILSASLSVSRGWRRQHDLLRCIGGNGGDNGQVRRQQLHGGPSRSRSSGPRRRRQGLRDERESDIKALNPPHPPPSYSTSPASFRKRRLTLTSCGRLQPGSFFTNAYRDWNKWHNHSIYWLESPIHNITFRAFSAVWICTRLLCLPSLPPHRCYLAAER